MAFNKFRNLAMRIRFWKLAERAVRICVVLYKIRDFIVGVLLINEFGTLDAPFMLLMKYISLEAKDSVMGRTGGGKERVRERELKEGCTVRKEEDGREVS